MRWFGANGSVTASFTLLGVVVWLASPTPTLAQSAWVPIDGEASVSAAFQSLNFAGHFDEKGEKLEGAVPSRAYLGVFAFEYAFTDNLAATARLPYTASKFTGGDDEPVTNLLRSLYEEFRRQNPDAAVTNLDTGDYYSTFQDFVFTLRYNLLDRGFMVTPVVGVTIPSHHYHTVGEAAPGQDRRALFTGVNVGTLLDPILPDAYVHGRYTYSFVESLVGVSLDRSNADFEFGYAIVPRLAVRGLASWMRTHGGVPFSVAAKDATLFLSHDRLLASRYWHVGAGGTVALTDSIDLDAVIITFLSGSDTHYGTGLNVGLTWRFLPADPSHPARRRSVPLN